MISSLGFSLRVDGDLDVQRSNFKHWLGGCENPAKLLNLKSPKAQAPKPYAHNHGERLVFPQVFVRQVHFYREWVVLKSSMYMGNG